MSVKDCWAHLGGAEARDHALGLFPEAARRPQCGAAVPPLDPASVLLSPAAERTGAGIQRRSIPPDEARRPSEKSFPGQRRPPRLDGSPRGRSLLRATAFKKANAAQDTPPSL